MLGNHDTPVIGRVDAEELAARLRMRRQILRGERLDDDDLAVKALATAARLSGQNSKPISLTGYILGRSRRTAEARDLLGALETASRQRYVPPYALALVHAGLGDADAAFEWLNRAYAARDVHLMFLTVDGTRCLSIHRAAGQGRRLRGPMMGRGWSLPDTDTQRMDGLQARNSFVWSVPRRGSRMADRGD